MDYFLTFLRNFGRLNIESDRIRVAVQILLHGVPSVLNTENHLIHDAVQILLQRVLSGLPGMNGEINN
ncbi:hypothetical protein AMECASPLE_028092 [Ameca splendens]|uniref:Uncharacterized protein n=1 Tax=Ameca splendens TaxID=208324 RepID=A0ABV0ZEZ0_9TELE